MGHGDIRAVGPRVPAAGPAIHLKWSTNKLCSLHSSTPRAFVIQLVLYKTIHKLDSHNSSNQVKSTTRMLSLYLDKNHLLLACWQLLCHKNRNKCLVRGCIH